MLPKGRSIKEEKDFLLLKDRGLGIDSSFFKVVFLKTGENITTKFRITVSNKVNKLAVSRNRIKRAVRESIRQNMGKIPEGFNIWIIAKESAAKMLTEDIMRDLRNLIDSKPFK